MGHRHCSLGFWGTWAYWDWYGRAKERTQLSESEYVWNHILETKFAFLEIGSKRERWTEQEMAWNWGVKHRRSRTCPMNCKLALSLDSGSTWFEIKMWLQLERQILVSHERGSRVGRGEIMKPVQGMPRGFSPFDPFRIKERRTQRWGADLDASREKLVSRHSWRLGLGAQVLSHHPPTLELGPGSGPAVPGPAALEASWESFFSFSSVFLVLPYAWHATLNMCLTG